MIFCEESTSGGDTLFYDDKWCDRAFSVKRKNRRIVIGPFNRCYHSATPWSGLRACIGAYVDENVLEFFYQFSYDGESATDFTARDQATYLKYVADFEKIYERETMNMEVPLKEKVGTHKT